MKPKTYTYYIRNDGQAIGDSRILYKKTTKDLMLNATSNESPYGLSGWILASGDEAGYLRPISNIIAETFWPNLCNESPKE